MGKRKSSSKPAPKKPTASLSRDFRCLFCHHDKTVQVKIDKGSLFGSLKCKDCGQTFSCPINPLSVHVDVYSEWVDACEEVKEARPAAPPQRPPNTLDHGFAGGARLNIQSNLARASRRAGEGELDEDEEEEDGEADYDDRRPNGRGGRGDRLQRDEDEEDEDEEEAQESDEEERKERRKKKKVRRERDDPDEDSD